MASANEIKKGDYVVFDGEVYQVLDKEHVAMQQRRAVAKFKVRHLKTGKVVERSVLALNEVEVPEDVRKEKAVFIYARGEEYWFHEAGNPGKRFSLPESLIGDEVQFLKSKMEVQTLVYKDEILGVSLPIKAEYEVVEAPPAIKGATAAGGNKQAKIDTGATVNVPMFIEIGDRIVVNTETGEYAGKAE